MSSRRKTFYLHEKSENPITAAGIILYKKENDKIYLLLIESRGGYEDLGGKVDLDDTTVYDTISREAYEESNYLLDQDNIKRRLNRSKYAYIKNSKYVTYVVNADENESQMTSDMFGDYEIHDNIPRKILWVPINVFLRKEIIKYKLHPRLKNNFLFHILREIEKEELIFWDIFDQ